MDGVRNWRFTLADGTYIEMTLTDFHVDYEARLNGNQIELGVTLGACWESVDRELPRGLRRRQYFENRIKQLKWEYQGEQGTLEIDKGLTGAATPIPDITLVDVQVEQGDNNELLEYALVFGFPLVSTAGGSGIQIARSFQFGSNSDSDKIEVSADNLIVEYSKQDTTAFKDVFRAAPIRIPGGTPMQQLRLFGISQATTGSTALAKRQYAEALMKSWSLNIGRERALKIDGVNLGLAHLKEATPGSLDLPDALTYELTLLQGYGS